MSALGQKRTFTYLRPMSTLAPIADIETQSRDVRFVPKADINWRVLLQLAKEYETASRDQDWTIPKFVPRDDQ
jgi:hypothetical protein